MTECRKQLGPLGVLGFDRQLFENFLGISQLLENISRLLGWILNGTDALDEADGLSVLANLRVGSRQIHLEFQDRRTSLIRSFQLMHRLVELSLPGQAVSEFTPRTHIF